MDHLQVMKMKILCLHGFRTSGDFLRKQISRWDTSIFANFDMDYPNGKYPAGGKSEIEGIFPPPYFEWFQFNKEFTEYTHLEECISYLCDYITNNGPFDGLLGFSQGATLAALLLGYKAQGKILKDHPEFKLLISISGSKFREPTICEVAYAEPIKVKSVHFIGEKDWLKLPSEELAADFEKPLVLRHPQGHTVPRLSRQPSLGAEQHFQQEPWPPEFSTYKNVVLNFLCCFTGEQDTDILRKWTNEICSLLSIKANGVKNDDDESPVVREESIEIEKREAESLDM